MALDLNTDKLKASYLALPDYQKLLITFGTLAILVGLYVYLLYMPKQEELETLTQKLQSMETTVSQNRAVEASLPRFEAEHKALNERLADALTQLPNSDEIPTLLQDMESIGNEASVKFEKLSLSKEKSRGFFVEVPVELVLSGSYHDIAVFFDRLSKVPRIINIANLNFSSPKNMDGKIMLNVTCRASIFKFAEKKEETKGQGKK